MRNEHASKKGKAHTVRLTSEKTRENGYQHCTTSSLHVVENPGCSALDDNEDAPTDTKQKLRIDRHRSERCDSQETSGKWRPTNVSRNVQRETSRARETFTAQRPTQQQHVDNDVGQDKFMRRDN